MTDNPIGKKELMGELGCSLNTLKKWARVHSIETSQQEFSKSEADLIRDAKTRTQDEGWTWKDYCASIGVSDNEGDRLQYLRDSLTQRYQVAADKIAREVAIETLGSLDDLVLRHLVSLSAQTPIQIFETTAVAVPSLEGSDDES